MPTCGGGRPPRLGPDPAGGQRPTLGGSPARKRAGALAAHLGQSAASGALPVLYAATMADVSGGDYFGPGGLAEQYGPPVRVRSSRRSRRQDDAARLWTISEELTGVHLELGQPHSSGDSRSSRNVPVDRLTRAPSSSRTQASA